MRNVVIIGSGPSGLTAALYAARANLEPLCFEGGFENPPGRSPGGQLMMTTEVENYPGFPEGIMGPDFIENCRQQAMRFGAELVAEDVVRVDFSKRPFKVFYGRDEKQVEARSVIVNTGAKPRTLGLPSEQLLMGHGVSTCATCDGAFHRDHEVIVIGGGDSAIEEGLFLTRFASKVYVIHRREGFRASQIMMDRAREKENLEIVTNTELLEVYGEQGKGVTGVRLATHPEGKPTTRLGLTPEECHELKEGRDGVEVYEQDVQGVFIAIGHTPNTEIFQGILDMDDDGYLLRNKHSMSNVEGVFIGGDCVDHRYRQAITAAGEGCQCAIDAERWLESQGV